MEGLKEILDLSSIQGAIDMAKVHMQKPEL
jgi:hypothetical protein